MWAPSRESTTMPDEDLSPRRTVTQAQRELDSSRQDAQSKEEAAEAAFFQERGEEIPTPNSNPWVRQTEEPAEEPEAQEEEWEEEEDDEGDFAAEAPQEALEEPEDEDGDEDAEEEPQPRRRRRGKRGKRRAGPAAVKAMEILRAQGVPQHILDKSDPEDLVAWGLEAATRSGTVENTPTNTQTPLELPDAAYEAMAEQLAVPVAELKKAQGPLLEALVAQMRQEFGSRFEQLEVATQESSRNQATRAVTGELERLSQLDRELATDTALQADIAQTAAALWNARTPHGERIYDSLDEAFNAAYEREVGPMPKAKTPRQQARRRNGTVTIPNGQRTSRTNRQTVQSFEEESFNALMDGKTPAWVRKNVRKPERGVARGRRSPK